MRVETLSLNQTEALFTITRRLTGSCYQPTETLSVSGPVVLTAALNPEHPFYEQVSWKDTESGKNLRLEPSGANQQNCKISPVWDPEGETNPAWIQNLIHRDRALKREKPLEKVSGSGEKTELVTAVSEDQTHGHIQAQCMCGSLLSRRMVRFRKSAQAVLAEDPQKAPVEEAVAAVPPALHPAE